MTFVILSIEGGGVELKMHDVILFAVFFLKASLSYYTSMHVDSF